MVVSLCRCGMDFLYIQYALVLRTCSFVPTKTNRVRAFAKGRNNNGDQFLMTIQPSYNSVPINTLVEVVDGSAVIYSGKRLLASVSFYDVQMTLQSNT